MAIFIRIADNDLGKALAALRNRQPVRVSMNALAEAILSKAVEACVEAPERWRQIDTLSSAQPVAPPD